MKFAVKLTILFLLGLTLAVSAFAQEPSPREQFQTAVAAYQKSPTRETVLKVIELYKQLDPPPAVPEEARRSFVMGVTVLKKANDKTGAVKAVEFFTEAVKTAPWFAEAYYNRALAREIAGQFTEAMDDLKLYLAFALSDAERRDAQDKIYSLEADAQLAANKAELDRVALVERKKIEENSPQAKARRDQELVRSLDGARFVGETDGGNGIIWLNIYELHGTEIRFFIERNPRSKPFPISPGSSGVATLKGREFFHQQVFGGVMFWQISEDGSKIQALYRSKEGEVKDYTPSNTTEPRRVR